MALLIGTGGGAAPVQLQVELIAPHRQPPGQRLELGQVGPQAAVPLGCGLVLLLPEPQLLKHFCRRAAAMVANPRQPEGPVHPRRPLPGQAIALHRQRIPIGADRGSHQGQQLGTTAAAPAKQPVGERIGGVPEELVGAEPTHASAAGHGRQTGGETKAVRQPGQGVLQLRKGGGAVVLAQLELAQQRGAADQHTIALDPGAIDRLEPTGCDRPAQAGEQLRPVLLQPGVEGRRGVGEMELAEALDQIQRSREGALGRQPGIGHRPQPGQVQVGVAQQVEATTQRLAAPQLGQLSLGFGQQAGGIGRIQGFELQATLDQGPVVVEGAAQLQLYQQGLPLPPALGQHPATGGIKQIAAMHHLAIHPQFRRIGPPAQHQTGLGHRSGNLELPPGFRTGQLQPQPAPLATPGPDQQSPGVPVRAMQGPPGIGQGLALATLGLRPAPQRLQIPSGSAGLRT